MRIMSKLDTRSHRNFYDQSKSAMCWSLSQLILLAKAPAVAPQGAKKTRMVSIEGCYTVIPSEPTPNGKLYLSDLDQIKFFRYASLLFVYKPDSSNHNSSQMFAIGTLRTSLSQALVHYFPLAGRVCSIESGRCQLRCSAMGAQILEANCEASLQVLGDFVPTEIVEQLMPKIDYACPIEQRPLVVAQLTKFRCGGLTLGVAFSLLMGDGEATVRFLKSWAKLARGESLDSSDIPFHDRAVLISRKLDMPPRFHHPEFCPPPNWLGSTAAEEEKSRANAAILKLRKDQVEKLKKKASDFGKGTPQRPYTSFEVIAGHLWKCICKARFAGNGDQPTRFSTLLNGRNRLSPPLPNGYFGTATFPTVTPTCSFDDLIHKPLSYAVMKIRQAVEKSTGDYLSSALDYIAQQKDMNFLRDAFHSPTASIGRQFRGNPNLYIVSWMNFPFYDVDFGWGKPVYMGPGHINSDGKAFIMDNGNGDGFIVAICLQPSHIDALKKFFYEDIKEVFRSSKL